MAQRVLGHKNVFQSLKEHKIKKKQLETVISSIESLFPPPPKCQEILILSLET